MHAREADIARLYRGVLPASRSGPLYNAFSYPTKISPESIALFIAAHTPPGSTVLDTFGGSGSTGLAAMLCDRPTTRMHEMANALGIKPAWGPRNAHVVEVGVLGSFVAQTLSSPPDPDRFVLAADLIRKRADELVGWMYSAAGPESEAGTLRHLIWSDVLVCPNCAATVTFWDAAVRRFPLALADEYDCPGCGTAVRIDGCERAEERVPDHFGEVVSQRRRVPVQVYGKSSSGSWAREPVPGDFEVLKRIADTALPSGAPYRELELGDLYRAGYHTGIEKLHHLYTRRNFHVLTTLWQLADEFDDALRDALRLLILSYNATHSTLMTRVVVKKGQDDFVLTGAQSGVLYISGLPVEKNILEGITRKAKGLTEAFRMVKGSRSSVVVHNTSSEALPLPNASVDYVFTDPPFGDYIPYAEVNQVNELWLGSVTDRRTEIVVSRAQGKSVARYGEMLTSVFVEIARVLRPGGRVTVVFHSAKSEVWNALVEAFRTAGFSVRLTSILDKTQATFKQAVSWGSVKGDPLILLTRAARRSLPDTDCAELAREVIAASADLAAEERTPQRLYSRFVGRCLELGVRIGISAPDFYRLASLDSAGPSAA